MEELQKSLEEQLKAPKTTKETGKGRGKTTQINAETEVNFSRCQDPRLQNLIESLQNNKPESLMTELKHLTLLLGKFIDSNYPIPGEQRPKVCQKRKGGRCSCC